MPNYANRGAYLEEMIAQANEVYMSKGLAIITKIPTPWKVKKHRQYLPYTRQYQILQAFPEKKSTVDFGGTADNFSIWFDVKATNNKRYFPLANILPHQMDYLKKVDNQGGKAFLLIHSTEIKKTWILWIDQLMKFIEETERKSITFEWLEKNCDEVKSGQGVALDYLPLVLKRKEANS